MYISSFFALRDQPGGKTLWPLFFVSFASLYIEVLLIRWIGTEVRVFAYFQNLALIVCFLGFGLGCYRSAAHKPSLFNGAALGGLLILAGWPSLTWRHTLEGISSFLSFSPDAQTWAMVPNENHSVLRPFLGAVAVISIFLLLIVVTMIPLGQWVGSYLRSARNPVAAYSANLLGSLAGIWFFAALSYLGLPPVYWFGFALLLLLLLRPSQQKLVYPGTVLLACGVALLTYTASSKNEIHWSPYQKIEVQSLPNQQYNILVNNTGYMVISNLSPARLAADPVLAKTYQNGSYDIPFRLMGKRDRVLIVGAGAGNDVDAALRNGAGWVDAVEIDPVIYALGKRLHPDHPYGSPRVLVTIDDARAFFRQARYKYDAVVFGLLDSHTEFSGYSNLRIDSYVYTEESLAEAKRLLKPSGVLIVKFDVRAPAQWMGQRFFALFARLFNRPPVAFHVPGVGPFLPGTIFAASNDAGVWERAAQPDFAAMVQKNPPQFSLDLRQSPALTTDDWPYIYNRSHAIPRTYLTISLIVLGIAFLLARGSLNPHQPATWNFFFLGAGFLLLETQFVSRLALYFGSNWWVNCIALTAILSVLVVANVSVDRGLRSGRLWYAFLIASLLALYFIPWQSLPYGTIQIGMLFAAAYSVPFFFAGVIFSATFRACEDRSGYFGSNILGAVAGGLAQNVSFIVGMKALLLLTAVFYTLAAVFGGRSPKPGQPPNPPNSAEWGYSASVPNNLHEPSSANVR